MATTIYETWGGEVPRTFGNNTFIGTDTTGNTLIGDARARMYDGEQGGDDTLSIAVTTTSGRNRLYGDSALMEGAVGGNDTLSGSDGGTQNFLIGDASGMTLGAIGGDDELYGGNGAGTNNSLTGDATVMWSGTTGGDDLLVGGTDATGNVLLGDAGNAIGDVTCGNDVLIAGDGANSNVLFGDASVAYGGVIGGDDTLISGTGDDQMYGDFRHIRGALDGGAELATTGNDTFVFLENNGHDVIHDFQQGQDVIDLSDLVPEILNLPIPQHALDRMPARALEKLMAAHGGGGLEFDALDSNGNGVLDDGDEFVSVANGSTTLDLGLIAGGMAGLDTVHVIGVTALVENDFIF